MAQAMREARHGGSNLLLRPHGHKCACARCRQTRRIELETLIDGDPGDGWDEFLPAIIKGDIRASVGRGGTNLEEDVRSIQVLLNTFILAQRLTRSAPLNVDGSIGAATISAIEDFQRIFVGIRNPDGRVDPGGRTLERLNGSVAQPAARPEAGPPSSSTPATRGSPSGREGQKALIERLCRAVEASGTLRGFTSFALAAAYTESRWSSSAHNQKSSEVSASCRLYKGSLGRGFFAENPYPETDWCIGSGGWFGLMPATGLAAGGSRGPFAQSNPRLIFDPAASVVMLADLVRRLVQNYRADSWLAVRRGMASPGLVGDTTESKERSRGVRRRFEEALKQAGLPVAFMHERPTITGYPGAATLLQVVRQAARDAGISVAAGELAAVSEHDLAAPTSAAHSSCSCPKCRRREQDLEAVIEGDLNDNWDQFLPVFITGDITGSVGRNGANDTADVRTVQRLLNPFIAGGRLTIQTQLVVDGQIGPATISAIEDFQRIFVGMRRPDGKVDPGGRTLELLNKTVFQPAAGPSGRSPGSHSSSSTQSGSQGKTFADAIRELGGKVVDPLDYSPDPTGFQNYLNASGIEYFSANEMITPFKPRTASSLGFRILLPQQNWWPRGAALAKLADHCRLVAKSPVRMRNWWRPKPYNDAVRGAAGSDHLTAHGIDLDYQTSDARRAAERLLKDFRAKLPWLRMSLGLGARITHVGLMSPRGQREWKYGGYTP